MKMHRIEAVSMLKLMLVLVLSCAVVGAYFINRGAVYWGMSLVAAVMAFVLGYAFIYAVLFLFKAYNKTLLLFIFYFFGVNAVVALIVYPIQAIDVEFRDLLVLGIVFVIPGSLGVAAGSHARFSKVLRHT